MVEWLCLPGSGTHGMLGRRIMYFLRTTANTRVRYEAVTRLLLVAKRDGGMTAASIVLLPIASASHSWPRKGKWQKNTLAYVRQKKGVRVPYFKIAKNRQEMQQKRRKNLFHMFVTHNVRVRACTGHSQLCIQRPGLDVAVTTAQWCRCATLTSFLATRVLVSRDQAVQYRGCVFQRNFERSSICWTA